MKSRQETLGSASPSDRFGGRVAACLTVGTDELPEAQLARLEAARSRALGRKKKALSRPMRSTARRIPSWLQLSSRGLKLATVVPFVLLAAGLWTIDTVTSENLSSDIAEIELRLLTSKLPLAAYTDPGFAEFVRRDRQNAVAAADGPT
ncbi:DUF3619 family protein [Variovorax sp. LG9.2]|uniref:DUF3619 family protein n=1 Tax=Variovorax sp. LG9.2 TaxID=3048626 RepID=UPI002B239DD6|nr:DUF3619 family protein [Variovorax sp. LG9.2]MEB0057591.1 DUF3619 family protein [Variovorax sp. LG9.2]